MKKKSYLIGSIILPLLMIITVLVTLLGANNSKVKHKDYDLMVEASELAQECFDKIKEYKISHNIEKDDEDKFDSYLLGPSWSEIYTTDGDINAKYTSINPNFAALYIKLFEEIGLKQQDEVAICCSGSFICLNISCLAACKVYGLKTCIMASVGASSHGATDPEFNNIDIIHYLNTIGLLNNDVDYASYGGFADTVNNLKDNGGDFALVASEIKNRIEGYGIEFIYEEDFKENINKRVDYIFNKLEDIKLFINIGGSSVGLGMGSSSFSLNNKHGIIRPNSYHLLDTSSKTTGLLEKMLANNITCIHMLNIKDICADYNMQYNFDQIPQIGIEDCYYIVNYNIVLPIITIVITLASLVIYYLDKKKIINILK